MKRKTTAAIIYNPDTNLFLGVSRKDNHSLWSFAGGKCEENESSIQCVIRETEEETGLRIKSMNLIDVSEHLNTYDEIPYTDECWTYAVRSYTGNQYKMIPTINEELVARGEGIIGWVTPEQLAQGPFGELCTHLVKVYFKYIGKK